MVSAVALDEFKQIWATEFGSELTDDKAMEEAANLLTMFDAIYRPLKQSDFNEYENAHEPKTIETRPSSAKS